MERKLHFETFLAAVVDLNETRIEELKVHKKGCSQFS